MFRFNLRYFLAASGLLLLEIFIALRVHDSFVRPYGGDFLATIFLYCLVRSFVKAHPGPVVLGALLFSYLIEGLQYWHLLTLLGWQQWRLARVVLGSHFEWVDMLAYTLGAAAVLLIESLAFCPSRTVPSAPSSSAKPSC